MTIEFGFLISIISAAAAIFFGMAAYERNKRKDIEKNVGSQAGTETKLEIIQTTLTEMKAEMKSDREERRVYNEKIIRNESSLAALHKRVDRIENAMKFVSTPEQGGETH